MQALFSAGLYSPFMATKSNLRRLREAAGLSVRELAKQIGQSHTNVSYWERGGQIPRSDVLASMAKALGVAVEELLGEPKPRRVVTPPGKMRRLFEAASKLPRSQQEKITAILEPFVQQHANGQSKT